MWAPLGITPSSTPGQASSTAKSSATRRSTIIHVGKGEPETPISALMPMIVDLKAYDGFERRVERLGLSSIVDEIKTLVTNFDLQISEGKKNDNGAAVIREILDTRFSATRGWKPIKSGGIDWTKCIHHNGAEVCIGVELQISARSDLLTNDLTHLVRAIELGEIDAGVIVVPCDRTAYFLTDRCPRYSYALDHVDRAKAQFSPLLLISIGHNGAGPALPKRRTNLGRKV